jgi:hypothetical protein
MDYVSITSGLIAVMVIFGFIYLTAKHIGGPDVAAELQQAIKYAPKVVEQAEYLYNTGSINKEMRLEVALDFLSHYAPHLTDTQLRYMIEGAIQLAKLAAKDLGVNLPTAVDLNSDGKKEGVS